VELTTTGEVVNPAQTPTSPSPSGLVSGQVGRVLSGDTIDVQGDDGTVVRVHYLGMVAPEVDDPERGTQCGGPAAAARNVELVLGQTVTMDLAGPGEELFPGLLVRNVWWQEQLVAGNLLTEGYGIAVPYPPDHPRTEEFVALAVQARSDGRGMWGTCGWADPRPPEELLAVGERILSTVESLGWVREDGGNYVDEISGMVSVGAGYSRDGEGLSAFPLDGPLLSVSVNLADGPFPYGGLATASLLDQLSTVAGTTVPLAIVPGPEMAMPAQWFSGQAEQFGEQMSIYGVALEGPSSFALLVPFGSGTAEGDLYPVAATVAEHMEAAEGGG